MIVVDAKKCAVWRALADRAHVILQCGKPDDYGVMRSIGIVDPFIGTDPNSRLWQIEKGARFWIFLHPNTVTGMRHHWQHPLIDQPAQGSSEAERWLRAFAERWGFDWDELIGVATNPTEQRDYIVARGTDLHSAFELGDEHAEFWQNLAVFTGRTYDAPHREKVVWSCSC